MLLEVNIHQINDLGNFIQQYGFFDSTDFDFKQDLNRSVLVNCLGFVKLDVLLFLKDH